MESLERRSTRLLAGWVLTLAATAPLVAQAPDCTGISGVFNSSPTLIGELTSIRIAEGLEKPVFVTTAPGDMTRVFIIEQAGRIRVVRDGVLLATPFLDIDPDVLLSFEEGLLGLAFHPDYPSNGWFFVYYTNNDGNLVVERFSVSGDPDVADIGSRVGVITLLHTFAENHNGGMMAFGPLDGRLYLGTGDGGLYCDPGSGEGNAQSIDSNLGKLLRLDVDSLPYSTAGNPFDGAVPGNDEIWSVGLRNPWRWSFDRLTGAIYIGDVGQFFWEEVSCAPASIGGGENYGWVSYEGSRCPDPSCPEEVNCVLANYVPPIREYDHTADCVVVGGYVYRGCRMPGLRGTYFYSDVCRTPLNTFLTDGSCAATSDLDRKADVEPPGLPDIEAIVSFGEDQRGEMYIVDYSGEVFKILPELSIMEVSGPNAPPFTVGPAGALAWEALEPGTSFVQSYKVYRSAGGPVRPFVCVHLGASPGWAGGDPVVPAPGGIFYYLITGQTDYGVESTAGATSAGTLRVVDTGSSCPG